MQEQDKGEFNLIMTGLASSFRHDVETGWLLIMWKGLRDLTISQFRQAADRAIRECRFMPTVSEFREFALGKPNVYLAWDALNRAIDRYGGGRSVDFEDKAINATVRAMGGWEALCEMPQQEFDRFALAKFERIYKSYQGRVDGTEAGQRLVGRHERRNRFLGHSVESGNPNIYLGQSIAITAEYDLPKIAANPVQDLTRKIVDRTND